jgi:hypothetical protein
MSEPSGNFAMRETNVLSRSSVVVFGHRMQVAPSETDGGWGSPRHRYVVLLILLTIIDAMQTSNAVLQFGSRVEANPLIRAVIDSFSIAGLLWVKLAVITALLLFFNRVRPAILLGSTLLMTCVVANNLVQLLLAGAWGV